MTRIVHLSDLHFDRVDPAIVAALRDEINADPPDLVAISGDLTQRAHQNEYQSAGAFLRSLDAPVLAVPGNHDITYIHLMQRFVDPFRRWRRYIAREIEPVWSDDTVAVIGLNTARRFTPGLDWSKGRFGHAQLRRLRQRATTFPDHLFRIVVAHHPLYAPEAEPDLDIAGRADEALACFRELKVGLVLSGHLHRGYVHAEQHVEGAPQLTIVQASTATSTRLRGEPNAYHRLTVEKDGAVMVEVRAWDGHRWRAVDKRAQGAALSAPAKAPYAAPEVTEVAIREKAPAGLG